MYCCYVIFVIKLYNKTLLLKYFIICFIIFLLVNSNTIECKERTTLKDFYNVLKPLLADKDMLSGLKEYEIRLVTGIEVLL